MPWSEEELQAERAKIEAEMRTEEEKRFRLAQELKADLMALPPPVCTEEFSAAFYPLWERNTQDIAPPREYRWRGIRYFEEDPLECVHNYRADLRRSDIQVTKAGKPDHDENEWRIESYLRTAARLESVWVHADMGVDKPHCLADFYDRLAEMHFNIARIEAYEETLPCLRAASAAKERGK